MNVGRLFINLHRILGTVLSILFLMWFLSGMVMMYHTYPSLTMQQRMQHAESLQVSDSLYLPACAQSVAFERVAGRNVCLVKTTQGEMMLDARTGQRISELTPEELMSVASRWSSATPTLIETLQEIDVWLIGVMPFSDFPVYHYALNDGQGSELYLSSRTGRALQLTDNSSRFWAWVGAIPHWIYIKQLRATGRQPWTDVVLWLSGFGIFMVLTGLVVGIRSLWMARRRGSHRSLSPYARPLFRWHHLTGLCFGLFVLTWIFSGFMSLADAPQLLWPVHGGHSARDMEPDTLSVAHFHLNLDKVMAMDEVKRVELKELGGMPFYHVFTAIDDYLVDASAAEARRVELSAGQCRNMVQAVHHAGVAVQATMLEAYDDYYVSQKHSLPLPVCRVSVADADGSTYYINPKNGACRYYNHNRRAGKWMYTGLHALNTPFFVAHPACRRSILWLLLLGGTIVSLTGTILACRYAKRLLFTHKTIRK